jgi:hypothetical protein
MGLLGNLLTGAAQSLMNKGAQVAQSSQGTTKKKSKTDCSPCAARAKQAALQQKIGVKSWYK